MSNATELKTLVRAFAAAHPIGDCDEIQFIRIEPIDVIMCQHGKIVADYTHSIKVSFGARDKDDNIYRGKCESFMKELADYFRSRVQAVFFFEGMMVYWDKEKNDFVGGLGISI